MCYFKKTQAWNKINCLNSVFDFVIKHTIKTDHFKQQNRSEFIYFYTTKMHNYDFNRQMLRWDIVNESIECIFTVTNNNCRSAHRKRLLRLMERAEVAASDRKSVSGKLERRSIKEEERYKVIEAQFSAGVSAKRRSGGGPGEIASKYRENKRPKDLKRAIGKLDKDDWNIKNIEEKLLIKKDPEGN